MSTRPPREWQVAGEDPERGAPWWLLLCGVVAVTWGWWPLVSNFVRSWRAAPR